MKTTKKEETVECFCLSNRGNLHCPLTTKREDLERTFNYRVRGEEIVDVEIDASFVCKDERKPYCENCPFK